MPESSSIAIAVYENEPSSVISFALNSAEYKRAFEELVSKKSRSVDHSPSPVGRRRNQSDSKTDDDKSSTILGFLRNKESKTDLHSQSTTVTQDNW